MENAITVPSSVHRGEQIPTIYALVDPRVSTEYRYIGRTMFPQRRLWEHIRSRDVDKRSHKNNWIKKLLGEGVSPIMLILEECAEVDLPQREMFWILWARDNGHVLTNATDGGDGVTSINFTPEARMNMSLAHRGHRDSIETKARKSAAGRGKIISVEQREAIRFALTGRKRNPEIARKALRTRALHCLGDNIETARSFGIKIEVENTPDGLLIIMPKEMLSKLGLEMPVERCYEMS